MTGKHLTTEQIDELNQLHACISVIADLMNPCPDLHIVNRDNMSLLLDYLANLWRLVMEVGE